MKDKTTGLPLTDTIGSVSPQSLNAVHHHVNADTLTFCTMIRNRSEENVRAMRKLSTLHDVLSPAFSILRQELDSMIRVIYLLQITDLQERERLIKSTLQGEKWQVFTPKGKLKNVLDRDMIDISQQLQGWTQSVYRFGCSFIHLSDFHNHQMQNSFQQLTETERQDVLSHMRNYHGGPSNDNPDMKEIAQYLPRILNKISSNLICYVEDLESGETSVCI
ncbi:TPA: hypothetical protein ACPZCO_003207 [Yersinia enterocolitica]